MTEYTPTTEQVRGNYASAPMAPEPREYAKGAFDRWLAERDKIIRQEERNYIAAGIGRIGFFIPSQYEEDSLCYTQDAMVIAKEGTGD